MEYPKGAIQSADQIVFGQEYFQVYGLGSSSAIMALGVAISIHEERGKTFPEKVYRQLLCSKDYVYLGDVNIGSHHNQHFLFSNYDDACCYLLWANANTAEIARFDWDDFEPDMDWEDE